MRFSNYGSPCAVDVHYEAGEVTVQRSVLTRPKHVFEVSFTRLVRQRHIRMMAAEHDPALGELRGVLRPGLFAFLACGWIDVDDAAADRVIRALMLRFWFTQLCISCNEGGMSLDPEYRILASGCFEAHHVQQHYEPAMCNVAYSPAERETIDRRWADAVQRAAQVGGILYSSSIFRLADVLVVDGVLKLELGDIEYKDYVATRDPTEPITRADPLGSVVIPVTADGYVPFGWRSPRLDVNPSKLFTFGGFFDRELDRTAAGEPDVFGCIQRELVEELGDVSVQTLRCIGVVYDCLHPHPEIAFTASLADTRERFEHLSPWSEEVHSSLLLHRDELPNFLRRNRESVCSTLRGALELFDEHG
jgi:hypothetical protein